jgi:glyceraldehyde 3-phosphate dehydrogenase/D-erythrose 4-phosphate dehydrogenase
MPLRISINGYGRVGRCLLRVAKAHPAADRVSIVAINELAPLESIAHLTRHDSIRGVYAGTVGVEGAWHLS